MLFFVFIKLPFTLNNLLRGIKCKVKFVRIVQTARDKKLPAIYFRKALNFDAYVSGNQFSAMMSVLILEPIKTSA